MAKRILLGFIGANIRATWAAQSHFPALASPDVELTAVCTTRRETAEAAREAFGAKLAFTDFREMVVSKEIDAVALSSQAKRSLTDRILADPGPGSFFRASSRHEEVGVLSRLLSSGGHGPASAAGGRTTERSGGVGAQVPPRTAEKGTTSRDADRR